MIQSAQIHEAFWAPRTAVWMHEAEWVILHAHYPAAKLTRTMHSVYRHHLATNDLGVSSLMMCSLWLLEEIKDLLQLSKVVS
jgi:hypothetical protein